MEDTCTITTLDLGMSGKAYYNAVYDGHGGTTVSSVLKQVLYKFIEKNLKNIDLQNEDLVKQKIIDCFSLVNKCLQEQNVTDGSTATILIYFEKTNQVYLINLGDSRTVLWDGEQIISTVDHKPNLPEERARIEKEGGFVIYNRLNGIIAVSRSFGDFSIKQISTFPDIKIINLTKNYYKFILASDGLWDVLPTSIITRTDLTKYSTLLDEALQLGSQDNITVIIGEIYNDDKLIKAIDFFAIRSQDEFGEKLTGIAVNNLEYNNYMSGLSQSLDVMLVNDSKNYNNLKKGIILTINRRGIMFRPTYTIIN